MRPAIEMLTNKRKSRAVSDITDFFLTYGDALTTGKSEILKKCWAVPGYVMNDFNPGPIVTEEQLEKFFLNRRKKLKTEGVAAIRPEILGQQWLTDQILTVTVHWSYLDKNSNEIGDETDVFNLKLDQNFQEDDDKMLQIRIFYVYIHISYSMFLDIQRFFYQPLT